MTGFLWRRGLAALEASAEALFPENNAGAPDWKQTELVRRTIDYLTELPASQARLIRTLFVAVELLTPFFCLRRFSKLSIEQRVALVRRWRGSGFYLLRILGDSLKAMLTMMYVSHQDVLRYIGMYATSPRPWDPVQIEVRSRGEEARS